MIPERMVEASDGPSWEVMDVTLPLARDTPNEKGSGRSPPPAPGNDSGPASVGRVVASRSPHIDAGEQEQPHNVDEVPVPGGSLEAEMQLRRERPVHGPDQTHREED